MKAAGPRGLTQLARLVALAGLIAAVPASGRAQTARAYLSQNDVALNRQFVLNVEIQGTQQIEGEATLPDLSAFATYLGSSTSTSMQIVNGRSSMSLTLQYRFQATAEGTFEIGPITVPIDGRAVRTDPLTIRISSAPAPTGRSDRPDDDRGVGPEDLFLTATPSAQRVYVNEPVVLEYRIFTRVDVEGYNVTRQPGTSGFWVEELSSPQGPVEQVSRDGVQYASSVIRRVVLFPTTAGPKRLEPLTIEAQVRVPRRAGRRGDPFSDPFDRFFGGGLFGSRVAVVAGSNPVEIDVLPLPPGQPDSFTGLVGELEVTTTVDRTSADTNDALTLRLEIGGRGNIRTLAQPELRFPTELEVYPPDVSERVEPTADGVRGSKVYEYVIVPRAPGRVTIPSVELSYLDADRGAYVTAVSDPITLTISGDPATPAAPAGRRRTGIDLQRQDIRFIRIATPSFRATGGSLFGTAAFWSVLLGPLLAVAGAVAWRRHQDRLRGDVAYARRRRASRVARQRLARAAALRSPDRFREFHAEVGRAMQGFLGDKLNVAEAGLITNDVRAALRARGVSPEVIDAYLACLDECDRQRFAPIEPDPAVMQDMLSRAEVAMTALDQTV